MPNHTPYTVQYGTTTIHYHLVHRNRRTLGIEVHPDGQVKVLAPIHASLEIVQARVFKRAGWILKQQREFASYALPQPERRFVSGETWRYLGRQYRLKLEQGTPEQVKLARGELCIITSDPSRVARLLMCWYQSRAESIFEERIKVCLERVAPFGISHAGGFKLKRMAKRWGSCTAGGIIYLNPLLVSAPKECIDYVITHELVHTVHLHHKTEFYALLSRCFPNWQMVRRRLHTLVELPKTDLVDRFQG